MTGRFALLVAVMVFVTACGDEHRPSGSITPSETVDRDRVLGAYVACIEEHGVDARITDEGAIHFDSGGTLSSQESQNLIGKCDKRLQDLGLVIQPEINEDSLRARYEDLESVRDCLLDLGYSTPDKPSLEAFLEDPTVQAGPYDHLLADPNIGAADLEAIVDECPDPGGNVVISD